MNLELAWATFVMAVVFLVLVAVGLVFQILTFIRNSND